MGTLVLVADGVTNLVGGLVVGGASLVYIAAVDLVPDVVQHPPGPEKVTLTGVFVGGLARLWMVAAIV